MRNKGNVSQWSIFPEVPLHCSSVSEVTGLVQLGSDRTDLYLCCWHTTGIFMTDYLSFFSQNSMGIRHEQGLNQNLRTWFTGHLRCRSSMPELISRAGRTQLKLTGLTPWSRFSHLPDVSRTLSFQPVCNTAHLENCPQVLLIFHRAEFTLFARSL